MTQPSPRQNPPRGCPCDSQGYSQSQPQTRSHSQRHFLGKDQALPPQDPTLSNSRRSFLGGAVALSAAGLASAGLGAAGLMATGDTQAQDVPGQFSGLTPLLPAPIQSASKAPVTLPPLAALVLNKAAFGPAQGDVAAFNALGVTDSARLSAWLNIQLNPGNTDPAVDARLAALLASGIPEDVSAYSTINKTAAQLWTEHVRGSDYIEQNLPVWQVERLTILRGMYSQWQLREVLFDFWFNHFNVYGREFPTQGMMPEYDRVVRQHMFGNFGDMLNGIAKTASMLYYLDNYANTWPYPNENYAREVLELHTLGAIENYYGAVDPATLGNNAKGQRKGYTEIDVFQFARALTGWGIEDASDGPADTGAFIFRPDNHYDFSAGPIKVMGVTINSTGGETDVTSVLNYLAGHFGTARNIAWKLCTRLIGDSPPASIVDSTAEQFYTRRNDSDQLREVYRHILQSTEFQTTWGTKVKRPIETVIRAMRAVGVDLTFRISLDDYSSPSNGIFYRLEDTSHYPFGYGPPTGFPDEKEIWQGSGPLVMSWRAVTYMLRISSIVNLADQTNIGIPVAADRTPNAIVDFWMNRALGYPLDSVSRDRIAKFIVDNLGMGGTASTTIKTLTTTAAPIGNTTYQKILRAVVGLILMSPEAMRR